jgi:hypothetical protein
LYKQLSVLCTVAAVCKVFLMHALDAVSLLQVIHKMASPREMLGVPPFSNPQTQWLASLEDHSRTLTAAERVSPAGVYSVDCLRIRNARGDEAVHSGMGLGRVPSGTVSYELNLGDVQRYFRPVWYGSCTLAAAATMMNLLLVPLGFSILPPWMTPKFMQGGDELVASKPCTSLPELTHLDALRDDLRVTGRRHCRSQYVAMGPGVWLRFGVFEVINGNHWVAHTVHLDVKPVRIKLMNSCALPPASTVVPFESLSAATQSLYRGLLEFLCHEAGNTSQKPLVFDALTVEQCVFIRVGLGDLPHPHSTLCVLLMHH